MRKWMCFLVAAMLLCGCAACQPIIVKTADSSVSSTQPASSTVPFAPAAAQAAGLSKDLYSYSFALNGKIIKQPCKVSDVAALGYSLEGRAAKMTLSSQTGSTGRFIDGKGGDVLTGEFYNLTDSTKPVGKCMFTSAQLRTYANSKNQYVFPHGIVFGDSVQKVMAAYGKPTSGMVNNKTASAITGSGNISLLNYYKNPKDTKNYVSFGFKHNQLVNVSYTVVEA